MFHFYKKESIDYFGLLNFNRFFFINFDFRISEFLYV